MRRARRSKSPPRPPNSYERALDSPDGGAFPFVLPLPDDVFRAIGHVLCQWAYFEQHMNEDLIALGPGATPPTDPSLMSRTFRKRITQWERIVGPMFEPDSTRKETAKLCGEILKLKKSRDYLAHGTWGVGDDSITLATYKYGQIQDLHDHDLNAASLETIAASISEFNARIFRLRNGWARRNPQPLPPLTPPEEWSG